MGVHPTSMKNAVKMPHAMSAGMFGMIMPDRNVPKRWTPTLALLAPVAGADAVVIAVSPLFRSQHAAQAAASVRAQRLAPRLWRMPRRRGECGFGDDSGIVDRVLQK